ncbi:MAG: hypothetical protein U1F63_09395 [Chitinivorax sp.]
MHWQMLLSPCPANEQSPDEGLHIDEQGAPRPEDAAPTDNHEAVLAALFDPVRHPQLEKMFPDDGKWAGHAERAARNGLGGAKTGRGVFNPYLAARWWMMEQRARWLGLVAMCQSAGKREICNPLHRFKIPADGRLRLTRHFFASPSGLAFLFSPRPLPASFSAIKPPFFLAKQSQSIVFESSLTRNKGR